MRPGLSAALLLCALLSASTLAEDDSGVVEFLEANTGKYASLAGAIWDLAEVGYQEYQSSALLQAALGSEGFAIERGVAGIPTAFVASYGWGEPVIAMMAEFDALPGISQSASPVRDVIADKPAGHACGHHLLGTGASAAAVAVKRWLEATGTNGTVRLYGTPAEEGGSGKVYMVREGLFDDVDAVLDWHPSSQNKVPIAATLANKSAKFHFSGVSAHAAGSPHRGRSALDGVEAMNFMVNMMREHVPQQTRIHYVITGGGSAPNVVPDSAEVYYYVRHPSAKTLQGIWDRVITAAEAAAMGTGTSFSYELMHGNHSVLPNRYLSELMHANLSRVGGVAYSEEEREFASAISTTLNLDEDRTGEQETVQPQNTTMTMGSTDVGDVSWAAPTARMRAATWVPGTASHSWQAIAAGGTSIGHKGMMVAAKTLALTAVELYAKPEHLTAMRKEFDDSRGADFVYEPLLGDRAPPLDYRR